jgi:excisionase family DNA binding protein
MSQELYSVDQVAGLLNLHVRTVRNYVRQGRLKAVRIGKQYRIAREDLEAMTGRPASALEREPVQRQRHVEVSSIVEIDAVSPDTANRAMNLLGGAHNARRPSPGPGDGHEPLRIETIYDAERARLKIVLIGGLDTTASYFKIIHAVLEA